MQNTPPAGRPRKLNHSRISAQNGFTAYAIAPSPSRGEGLITASQAACEIVLCLTTQMQNTRPAKITGLPILE